MLQDTAYTVNPVLPASQNEVTVAVLPFRNLSSDNQYDHICAGFTLDLITDFSRFRSVNIISHHSTGLLPPDEDADSETIKRLQAGYLVKGSFRHLGERIRVTTQLVSTRESRIIWSENFEEASENIFSLEENVLKQIVNALQHHVNYDIISSYKKKPTTDLSAYTSWLLGMNELRKGTLDADIAARSYFKKALEKDPGYSRAYTGMSLSYFNEWSCQIWDRWEVSQKGAFRYAQKAIELDDQDYIAAMVLGRVNLYDGNYEEAEYYLRKSVHLNPNDTDNLIQVSTCLTMLGYAGEALKLYERAFHLNPVNNDSYRQYGAFIYFELGEFTKCLSLIKLLPGRPGWIDLPAYVAAAWYMLGDQKKMNYFWNIYLDGYINRINHGNPASSKEALEWMIRVNPFRKQSQIQQFWNFMGAAGKPETTFTENEHSWRPPAKNVFREENGIWRLSFDGEEVVMAGSKGFQDIWTLICKQGVDIHCSALMGSGAVQEGIEVFDEKAKKAYGKKIIQLKEQIAAAESLGNMSAARLLQQEYDNLLTHLSDNIGIGGRTRRTGNVADKMRSAVTWRIRNSIRKIEKTHAALAKHLDVSIRTGTFCVYAPEKSVEWEL